MALQSDESGAYLEVDITSKGETTLGDAFGLSEQNKCLSVVLQRFGRMDEWHIGVQQLNSNV